jgi:hypothetical protein
MSDLSSVQSKSTILSHVRITPTIWMLFLIVCLAAGGLKTFQNDRFRSETATYHEETKRLEEKYRTQQNVDLDLIRSLRHPNAGSLGLIEKQLNGARPLYLAKSDKHPDRKTAICRRSPDSPAWKLDFNNEGRLVGWQTLGTSNLLFAQRKPVSQATFEGTGEKIRRSIVQNGPWIWAPGLLAWLFFSPLRSSLSHALLMVATSIAIAQLVAPNYTLPGLFSNDALFFGALMVSVSVASLARTSPQIGGFVAAHILPHRFGIKWILALTATIAILVRLGWYGYVIGSILAAAIVWYLLMASVVNRPTA